MVEVKNLYEQLQVLESVENPLEPKERILKIQKPLLYWYEKSARDLPWRNIPNPYGIWISEIMLQQTRVEAVKPYYERFLKELPTVSDLAEVEETKLLKLWEGLGYYSRAKNLKKAACMIVEAYDGIIPCEYKELMKLPGIGSYTAGAIASMAYGKQCPAVDGNVLRVISRLLASKEDILKSSTKKNMELLLTEVIPTSAPGDFNQSLIELGAMVCIPNGQPKCLECPMESLCLAKREGLIQEIPVKTPPKKRKIEQRTVVILECEDTVGICKRPDKGLLASLFELPNVEGYLEEWELAKKFELSADMIVSYEVLPPSRHIFSHVEWHMKGYRVVLKTKIQLPYVFVDKVEIKTKYPLPNAFGTYVKRIGCS